MTASSALPSGGSVEFSNESSRVAHLVLNTPLIKDYILHHTGTLIKDYVRKHSESWNIFANRKHGRGVKADQIMLVTHCYRTASWTASIQLTAMSKDIELSVSCGVLGAVQAGLGTSCRGKIRLEPIKRSGPPPPDVGVSPANTETVFVDGIVLSRFLNILPLSVRAIQAPQCSAMRLIRHFHDILAKSENYHANFYALDYLDRGPQKRLFIMSGYNQNLGHELMVLHAIDTLESEHILSITWSLGLGEAALAHDPFKIACYFWDVAAVVAILRSPACRPSRLHSIFGNPLVAAVAGGDESILLMLQDHDVDINAHIPDRGSGIALHVTAKHGDERMVRNLLDAGMSIEIDMTLIRVTPFGMAIDCGHFTSGHLHLKRSVSVKTPSLRDRTQLLDEVVCGGKDDLLRALLSYNSDVQTARPKLIMTCEIDVVTPTEMLLDYGMPVKFILERGSPLEVAPTLLFARCLIDRDADVHAEGGTMGGSPLIATSAAGHTTMVDLLLDSGANINVQGSNYGRALHFVSARGHDNAVAHMLQCRAYIDAGDPRNGRVCSSAIETVASKGHNGIVRAMLTHNLRLLKRQDARHTGHYASSRSRENEQESLYGSALEAAAGIGCADIFEIPLVYGANANLQGDWFGNAPEAATVYGHKIEFNTLLDHGTGDIEAVGRCDMTAVQAAEKRGNKEIVRQLVQRGANPNPKVYRDEFHPENSQLFMGPIIVPDSYDSRGGFFSMHPNMVPEAYSGSIDRPTAMDLANLKLPENGATGDIRFLIQQAFYTGTALESPPSFLPRTWVNKADPIVSSITEAQRISVPEVSVDHDDDERLYVSMEHADVRDTRRSQRRKRRRCRRNRRRDTRQSSKCYQNTVVQFPTWSEGRGGISQLQEADAEYGLRRNVYLRR